MSNRTTPVTQMPMQAAFRTFGAPIISRMMIGSAMIVSNRPTVMPQKDQGLIMDGNDQRSILGCRESGRGCHQVAFVWADINRTTREVTCQACTPRLSGRLLDRR